MNRTVIDPTASMSDCPVQWRELESIFSRVFPRTIQDALDNDLRARVQFLGVPFDIIPEIAPGFPPRFSVWGPPHINEFPDSF